jgi:hypothetical protein
MLVLEYRVSANTSHCGTSFLPLVVFVVNEFADGTEARYSNDMMWTAVLLANFAVGNSGCGVVPLSCAPDCAKAIQTAMVACSASGGGTVSLNAGTYVLADAGKADMQPMLGNLPGLTNVALVGAGTAIGTANTRSLGIGSASAPAPTPATAQAPTVLEVHGNHGFLILVDSVNITMQDFEVDMNRTPYTYGVCISSNTSAFTIKYVGIVHSLEAISARGMMEKHVCCDTQH